MPQIEVTQAQQLLPQLIEAALGGAEIIITSNQAPLVKLAPVQSLKPRPQFGSAKGLVSLSDDFDEPLEDFREYMQ